MNLTLSQAFDRTKDLSGLIKAARAHEADCAADHEAKLRIAEIAAEAHNKAVGHCLALEQEREELADHIAGLVRRTGEPLEEPTPNLEAVALLSGETVEDVQSALDRYDNAGNQHANTAFNSVFSQGANEHASRMLEHSLNQVNDAFMRAAR